MICHTANVARVITLKEEDVPPAVRALREALLRLEREVDGMDHTTLAYQDKIGDLIQQRRILNSLLVAVES